SDKDRKTEDLVRVVLVKLLDRIHNMRTIQFMPSEKQFEKATETLLVYAPMADAFRLDKLGEQLRRLALEVLDPEARDEMNQELKTRMQLISDYQSTKILDLIKEKLNQNQTECLRMNFIPPSYNEIYEAMDIYPYELTDNLRIQMVMEDKTGETEDAWKVRMRNMLNVLAQSLQFEGEKFVLQTIAENSAEQKIEAVLHFEKDGISRRQISVHMIGRKTYIAENASLLDLFTRLQRDFGNRTDWQISALRNISNIRKNYKKSKGKDLDLFFETVGGQKIVFDKKGNPIFLPLKATLFDALWMMYGEDVLRSTEVYVKEGEGIVTVRREDFGKQLNDRAQIKGLEVWILNIAEQPHVLPTDIQNSYVSRVRGELIDYIENKQAQPENARENIIDYGYRFIRSHYNDVWDHLKREEYFQQTIHAFVNISPSLVHHIYEQVYPTIEDLAYAVGSGRIKKSLYHRLIKEMIKYRDECIYIALGTIDYPSKAHLIPQILAEYKLLPLKHEEDMYRDPYKEVTNNYQMWFHPSQLGEQTESKLEELIGRFEKEGFNITADRNSYKALPVDYGQLPPVELVADGLLEVI
ncbi:MAG: HD domain-containing protein, partial [Bacteroidetes bacterium]